MLYFSIVTCINYIILLFFKNCYFTDEFLLRSVIFLKNPKSKLFHPSNMQHDDPICILSYLYERMKNIKLYECY